MQVGNTRIWALFLRYDFSSPAFWGRILGWNFVPARKFSRKIHLKNLTTPNLASDASTQKSGQNTSYCTYAALAHRETRYYLSDAPRKGSLSCDYPPAPLPLRLQKGKFGGVFARCPPCTLLKQHKCERYRSPIAR